MSRAWSTEHDHLAALALPLHPREVPTWSWEERAWVWIPAWSNEREVLGRNGGEAGRALLRLRQQIPCGHGVPLTRSCSDCRAEIVQRRHAAAAAAA